LIYGNYKNVRDAAWQCILDHNIMSLPVDLLKVAAMAGIKVLKNSEVCLLSGSESGVTIFDGKSWYLIYEDESTLGRRYITIAHELGHFFLGHELLSGRYGRTFNSYQPKHEEEADFFAARLLAPSCVLWGLDLHTADEIANVCKMSIAEAKKRAERIKVLYRRQKFLTHTLERDVYGQFKRFIEGMKAKGSSSASLH